jgi:hypothetical protein
MTPPFRLLKFTPSTRPIRSTPYLDATSETFLEKLECLAKEQPGIIEILEQMTDHWLGRRPSEHEGDQ